MSVDALLSRLEGVRTGARPNTWTAKCPSHADKSPSLSVRELDDGRILLHDFGGCGVADILAAVDLTFDALFPPRSPQSHSYPPVRRPWIPSDIFEIARREIMVVALIGCHVHAHRNIPEDDYQRLFVAVSRLNGIAEGVYGSR